MKKLNHGGPSIRWIVTAISLNTASQALAHPGHGTLDHGLFHALTSPGHLAVLAAIGILLALSASALRNARARAFARAGGIALMATAVALWAI